MKPSRLLFLGLLSLSVVSPTLASPSDMYPKVYDATYETKGPYGTTQLHMLSNGKGQTRTETAGANGIKTISIIDYPGHTSWTILEAQKMIMRSPLKSEPEKMDAAQAKKLNATDLGKKMVSNHMCQGWSYKTAQVSTESWIDDAAQVPIKSTTLASGKKTEMNLKTLSTAMPAAANFKPPAAGYKLMATP